ncbi:hypothetical protein AB0M57_33620 [Streptomyces sp. NPDC051597]|uniref:hypothetical protein n=1 Tax=Streptomyces sp. NPDC051597 TaxID=3155049 RepID=UPI003434C951
MVAAVRNLRDKRFNGYLGVALPHDLDTIVEEVVIDYLNSSHERRTSVLNETNPRAAGVLSVYGERMAAIAVRSSSQTPLERGLVAMGMAQGRLEYSHDNLIVLAAVNHSALAIGSSLSQLITVVADALPAAALSSFLAFAGRTERDKALTAMRLGTSGSGPTLRYVSA